MIDPISYHVSVGKIKLELLEFPPINSRNFLVMQSGVGIQGKQYISPKLTIPTSSCIHPSTHNQETLRNRVPQPSKSIRYTSYGNTPELSPVLGYRGYLTNNYIKEIFDVGETNLRYSRTATIKLWRQHLGAQLPGTLPQPLNVRRHLLGNVAENKNFPTVSPRSISEFI